MRLTLYQTPCIDGIGGTWLILEHHPPDADGYPLSRQYDTGQVASEDPLSVDHHRRRIVRHRPRRNRQL